MELNRVHRLVVVDEDGRRPVGIFSTTDVVHQAGGGDRCLSRPGSAHPWSRHRPAR